MSQSRVVIQTLTVECVNQTSNKFYEVVLVVCQDKLTLETYYGAKNSKPKQGVSGGFVVADVARCAGSRDFEILVSRLVKEANKIVQTKLKKGYAGRVTSFDTVVVLTRINQYFPTSAAAKALTPQPDVSPVTAEVTKGIEVEVIGIVASKLKIAKVLEDFSYEVLGEVVNSFSKPMRIGDVVQVVHKADGYTLI